MEPMKIANLYAKALEELALFRPMMYDIYSHTLPNKNTWKGNVIVPGERTDLLIFNDHPQTALRQWAANLVSNIAPNGSKFFNLKPIETQYTVPEDYPTVEADLEKGSDRIFELLNESNFYQALIESCIDLGPGMGGYTINYDQDGGLYFTSLDMSTVSVLEDHMGRINYVFRTFEYLDEEAQRLMFPNIAFDNSTLSILECVVPCVDPRYPQMKFKYMVTDTSFSRVYFESYSETNPFVIFRWSKRCGENRGRGILCDILGTIKMTNVMARDVMNAAAYALSPPVVTNKGSLLNPGNLKIEPGGIITLNTNGTISPFPMAPNLPFGLDAVGINNALIDKALMVNDLGVVGQGVLTATEVQARLQRLANEIGPTFTRLQRELMNPTFARVIELLEKNGAIAPVTVNTQTGGKRKIKLVYSSPIIDAAKTIEAQKLAQAIQYTTALTGSPIYVAAAYKLEQLPRYAATAYGARMDLLNTQDEVLANLENIKQTQQQQQEAIYPQNPALNSPINTGVFQGAA